MCAAGAEEVVQEPRYAHLIGGARMGNDPRTSVVDSFGRSHDIPNLFLCDGSIFPTQGSANPGLTIQALAARTADYLIAEGDAVTSRNGRRPYGPANSLRSLASWRLGSWHAARQVERAWCHHRPRRPGHRQRRLARKG